MDMETNIKQAVPFFGVSNMVDSTRYYMNGLGFKMTKKWVHEGKIRWCWLERDSAALMLQEFWKDGPIHHVLESFKCGMVEVETL